MHSKIQSYGYLKTQKNPYPALKSRSLKANQLQFDDSFLQENDFEHPKTVQKAIIQFIEQCLGQKAASYFNETQSFAKKNKKQNQTENQAIFGQQLQKDNLMSSAQQQQFILDLQNQKYLKKFMEQIKFNLNQKIYSEIFYIGMKIWERFLEFQKDFIIQNPIIQRFKLRKELLQQISEEQPQIELIEIPLKTLLAFGDKIALQMHTMFLNDEKLKWIVFREVDVNIPTLQMHLKFKKALQVIIKGVLLSIEEYFQHPDSQNGQFYKYFELQTNILQIENQGEDCNALPEIYF